MSHHHQVQPPTQTARTNKTVAALALLVPTLLMGACSSTPKSVVELSYLVGQDISELHRAHDTLITAKFDGFRRDRIRYLEDEWIPTFIGEWISNGQLVAIAKGEVVWSDQHGTFVPPTPGHEARELFSTVLQWSLSAQAEIDEKRQELIDPLDRLESSVRGELRQHVDRMLLANSHVTAHLNSLRKVQSVQDEIMSRLGIDESISDINQRLSEVSEWVASSLQTIRQRDEGSTP